MCPFDALPVPPGAGTWRVGGVLAVSRAFGDRPLKRYVPATPDVNVQSLSFEDEFIVMASDGVWDVMSNQVRPCTCMHVMPLYARFPLHAAFGCTCSSAPLICACS